VVFFLGAFWGFIFRLFWFFLEVLVFGGFLSLFCRVSLGLLGCLWGLRCVFLKVFGGVLGGGVCGFFGFFFVFFFFFFFRGVHSPHCPFEVKKNALPQGPICYFFEEVLPPTRSRTPPS